MRLPVAVIAAVLLLCSTAQAASAKTFYPTSRPTFGEAREVVHHILDTYAAGTDGNLILGGCRRHGNLWIVCRARIEHKRSATRYRFQISGTESGDYVVGTSITTAPRRAASAN